MNETSELFKIAVQHCDSINEDLDCQEEKLINIKNKIKEHAEGIHFNYKYISNMKKASKMKRTYGLIIAIIIFFSTIFSFIKFNSISKGPARFNNPIEIIKNENEETK
ncbi:hypothetical protein NUSPORA_00370 [Nucleospora cyclopteri]